MILLIEICEERIVVQKVTNFDKDLALKNPKLSRSWIGIADVP